MSSLLHFHQFVSLFTAYGKSIQTKIHIVKPWSVNLNAHSIIKLIVIHWRLIAYRLSILCIGFLNLLSIHLYSTLYNGGQRNYIRIFIDIQFPCNSKISLMIINENSVISGTDLTGYAKIHYCLFVIFTIFQLAFYILYRTVPPFLKPW